MQSLTAPLRESVLGNESVKGCPTAYRFACPLTLIYFLAALLIKYPSAHYKCAKEYFLFAFIFISSVNGSIMPDDK